MEKLLFALVPISAVLVVSEYLWRRKIVKGERARKFIHILSGVYMAFWPFYLPFDGIFILGAIAITVLVYSRITRLFHAIYAVDRKTYGEIFFAAAIMACAYLGQEPWIFSVSILLMALCDGGAAVVGRLWGENNTYRVFGSASLRKSVYGTMTFLVLAYVAVGVGFFIGGREVLQEYALVGFVLLPIAATVMENITPYGLDNLVTPLFATILLNSLL